MCCEEDRMGAQIGSKRDSSAARAPVENPRGFGQSGGAPGWGEDRSGLHVSDARLENAETLWHWRNDSEVRRISSSPDPIPWGEHLMWFRKKLGSPDDIILIGWKGDDPFGVVRFEREAGEAIVSISVSALHRGKGWGSWILAKGIREMQFRWAGTPAVAFVWKRNEVSVRLFAGEGFVPSANESDPMERFVLAPGVRS